MMHTPVRFSHHGHRNAGGHRHHAVKRFDVCSDIEIDIRQPACIGLRLFLDKRRVCDRKNLLATAAECDVHVHILVYRAEKRKRPVHTAEKGVHRLSAQLLREIFSVQPADVITTLRQCHNQRIGFIQKIKHCFEKSVKICAVLRRQFPAFFKAKIERCIIIVQLKE